VCFAKIKLFGGRGAERREQPPSFEETPIGFLPFLETCRAAEAVKSVRGSRMSAKR